MQRLRFICILLFTLSVLVSCGEQERLLQFATEQGRGSYSIEPLQRIIGPEIDTSNLKNEFLLLANDINETNNKSISTDHLYKTNLIIDAELSKRQSTTEEIQKRHGEILSQTKKAHLPFEFKKEYEKILEEKIIGTKLKYNKNYNSIRSLLFLGKMQSRSGTLNYLTLRLRALGINRFYQDYSVVILTEGHILPGVLKLDRNNDFWLYGVETTAAGKALTHFGRTKDVDSSKIRVIDAIDYLIVRSFQNSLFDEKSVAEQLIIKSAKEFNIPIDQSDSFVFNKKAYGHANDPYSHDLFAFGVNQIKTGDKIRPSYEEKTSEYAAELRVEDYRSYPTPNELLNGQIAVIETEIHLSTPCKEKVYKNLVCENYHIEKYTIKSLKLYQDKVVIEDTYGVYEISITNPSQSRKDYFSCDINNNLIRETFDPEDKRYKQTEFTLMDDSFYVYGEYQFLNLNKDRKSFLIDMECTIQ